MVLAEIGHGPEVGELSPRQRPEGHVRFAATGYLP